MKSMNGEEILRIQKVGEVNLLDENCEPTGEQLDQLFHAMMEDVNERALIAKLQQDKLHNAGIKGAIEGE